MYGVKAKTVEHERGRILCIQSTAISFSKEEGTAICIFSSVGLTATVQRSEFLSGVRGVDSTRCFPATCLAAARHSRAHHPPAPAPCPAPTRPRSSPPRRPWQNPTRAAVSSASSPCSPSSAPPSRCSSSAPNPVPNYEALFLSLGSNDTAASHLRALTLHPHVAGTKANALTARYVLDALSFPAHITPYSVLLSYPVHRSLSLLAPGRGVVTSFSLKQETYPNDPYAAAAAETIPTFYAYAASGSVSAEAVYANYGREEDFAYLASRGVDVAGKVALARYGRIHC